MNELMAGLRELKTAEQRRVLWLMLRVEAGEVKAGGLLAEILKWISEHPEEFAALIALIISLFG